MQLAPVPETSRQAIHRKVPQHTFLMAEDNPADEELVREMLRQVFGSNHSIVCVDRFSKIAGALKTAKFETLILDMGLPDRSGVENVTELSRSHPDLPIVVLTGQDDLDVAIDALQQGAQDYLSKNHITPEALLRSLRYAKERKHIEQQLRHALEDSAHRNIQLEAQAKHDPLTGLPNRTYLHEAGNRMLHQADRHQKKVALLFFDLNNFKKVNDSYGHLTGDKLIREVAQHLRRKVRESDVLVRWGGDEFIVLTDLLESHNEIYPLLRRLQQAFAAPFMVEDFQIAIRPSIGVAFYPNATSLDLLLKNADSAMYEAKKDSANNHVCFFNKAIAERYAREHDIEQHLGAAVLKDEFDVVFQPIVSLRGGAMSVEALIRWNSPDLGPVSPADFISLAERTPTINDITRLVVRKAGVLMNRLEKQNSPVQAVNINICASQLEYPFFCDVFVDWLEEFGLHPSKVCIELTERQMVLNAQTCQEQFRRLRSLGVTIALDDYGTGFSSLTHLIKFEIDTLKLDRSLVDNIDNHPRHQALAAGIVEMARHMDMTVLAEGIERREELDVVNQLGFERIQGFFIAKPLSLDGALGFFSSAR